MPLRPRRSALAAVAGALVALSLAGCASSSTAPPQASAIATRPVQPAELRGAGARVVDDEASSALVLVPKKANGGLVVFLHGWGQTRWSLLSRPHEARVAHAISEAGFTILAADGDGKAWGDPASIADYRLLIDRTQQRYGLRDVFLMGESMGGLATMQLGRLLPDVRASTAWFPVCDLRTMHEARFQATIRTFWQGRSRSAVEPVAVGDTPLLVWASPADTVVNATTNAAVCVAEAEAAGAPVTYFHTTGEHGDPSNYQPATIVQFFEKYRTPGV